MSDADIPEAADAENGTHVYDPDEDHAFPDEKLNELLPELLADPEVTAYLEAQNVNAVTRKGYNDHGPKHIEIVRNRALRLYDLLKRGGVEFNGAAEQGGATGPCPADHLSLAHSAPVEERDPIALKRWARPRPRRPRGGSAPRRPRWSRARPGAPRRTTRSRPGWDRCP